MAGGSTTEIERYGGGPITIHDYDPTWPAQYEEERACVQSALASLVTTIEHVGSTAVPGLAAKPIIDMLVGVRDLSEARAPAVEALKALRYRYRSEYEVWLPHEMLFRKGIPGPWTHHVHLMEPLSPRWDEFVLMRDYIWKDFSEIPPQFIPATEHPLFVGMVTNTLFGLLIDLNATRRRIWPWADHVLFWGLTLAVAAFTMSILFVAKDLYPIITPVLGGSILVGIIAHTLRLRAPAAKGS